MGVTGVFWERERDLEIFSGEIRPNGSEWEVWMCLSVQLLAVRLKSFWGYFGMGKLEICWAGGRESIWDERDAWGLRDFNSPARVRFHWLTYLEEIRWVKHKAETKRDRGTRSWTFLSRRECVSVGNPPNCSASNFSSELIKPCQNKSITV